MVPDPDILQTLREVIEEDKAKKRFRRFSGFRDNSGKIATFRRYLIYTADFLDIVLDIVRDRRRYDWRD